jgi:galactose mutarotase-like enzyme
MSNLFGSKPQVVTPQPAAPIPDNNAPAVLEAQHLPDALHHPDFPGPVTLAAGATYSQHTSYAFANY